MDGGEIGELEYENFNAAVAKVTFCGRNVHPGYAKHKMINSPACGHTVRHHAAALGNPRTHRRLRRLLPLGGNGGIGRKNRTHIYNTRLRPRPLRAPQKELQHLCRKINNEFPGCASIEISDQYFNMREKVEPVSHIIEIAEQAMKNAGITPRVVPIRGGTDGAQLSFKGLPCPNIFAGGLSFHGRYEFVPVPSMEKAAQVIVEIARLVASRN